MDYKICIICNIWFYVIYSLSITDFSVSQTWDKLLQPNHEFTLPAMHKNFQ